jgi:TonB family protein
MKKNLIASALLILCFVGVNFAQEKTAENQFEFRGIVKDQNSAVFSGLPLYFKSKDKEDFVSTDLNGEFLIKLSPGNYEITVRETISETFKAYINIQENGLNPNHVEFVVETNSICCGTTSEKPYPKIIKLPKPPYPAAARAVRAAGEVVVEVKIDRQGKVISTKAVSGHPLLRAVSEKAAQQSLYEESENDEQREVKLTFVFLPGQNEKENIKRYSNPYRVEIIGEIEIILNTMDTKKS